MDKLFLLGLFVLYLSKDGESTIGVRKEYDELEGVACHVCKRYVDGRCLENEDTCVIEQPSRCEAKVFSVNFNGVWQNTYSILNCNSQCKETESVTKGIKLKIFCCNQDFCNKFLSKGM